MRFVVLCRLQTSLESNLVQASFILRVRADSRAGTCRAVAEKTWRYKLGPEGPRSRML